MMRPVDADAIYNEALENHQKGEIEDWEFDSIINYLDGAPTINTVEIVYCKDCKYGSYDSKPNGAMVCLRTNDGFWRKETDFAATASIRQIQEVTTMFQIELLSGGVFWVYAVYPQNSAFLIWKDDHWVWMVADKCKPYYPPAESYLNKQLIFPMETGGAK